VNGLTDKQKAWVNAYLECWNGAEAARRAGYESVYQSAHDNITNPKIRGAIQARLDLAAMTADEVLRRLSDQARGDLSDIISVGCLLDWDKLKASGKSHLIKKYRITQNALGQMKTEVEMYDAQRALELIGKAHGLFRDVQEQRGEVTVRVVYDNDKG
jgi:hypothetical protein